jgi:perosamine synthetase
MMDPIPIAAPDIGDAEVVALVETLRSGILAAGPRVAALEARICDITGARHAVAVANGTAAIHCAVQALGIGPGDEVVTVPFTFVATANPVIMQGGRLRFVDIDLDDYCIDPAQIAAAITDRTKAVIVVDLYGQPVDVAAVSAACGGLPVIEDACQAIGATVQGGRVGNVFTAATFSLYATKNVTCGEGGVLTTNDDEIAAAARRFRQHGMTGPYEYAELGYNYRLTDLHAAVADVQLQRLDELTDARRTNAALLTDGLDDVAGLVLPVQRPDRTHVWHQYVVRVTDEFAVDRATLIDELRARGVASAVYYPQPLYAYPHVAAATDGEKHCPNAERAAREVLALPVHPRVGADGVARIIDAVREVAGA